MTQILDYFQGFTKLRYYSPLTQILLVSLVAFGCPGMYNALTGLGGAGRLDPSLSANGNVILHAVACVCYLFVAPIVYNVLGPRWTIFIGGVSYPLYGGSLLAYSHIESKGFVYAASAILGVGSTLFWVGQGALMVSQPTANEKGRAIAVFWFIFNVGGVIGSFIAMGINWDSKVGTISDATYAVFIALMGAGWLVALSLANPSKVVRDDGTRVHVDKRRPDVIRDFIKICRIIPRKQSICMLLFFFVSNYFYSYQQNTVNGRLFDIRTRGFNGAMYWFSQMVAALAFGWFLDVKRITRKRRAIYGFVFLLIYSLILWGGGLALQLRSGPTGHYYKPHDLDMIESKTKYAGPFVLYFFYGAFDALWQTFNYWMIGCLGAEKMDDEDDVMARYIGLYKAMCGVGQVVAWKVNAEKSNFNLEFGLNWGLITLSLVFLSPILLWIKEPEESNADYESEKADSGSSDAPPDIIKHEEDVSIHSA